ncbi:FAD-binding protein [Streptomyces canus]|uniref:FAD-binding protein n=1 Tax=Streptomyces canus TaxID=58343 RepID=UPI0033CB7BC0
MTSSNPSPFHAWRLRTVALAKQVPQGNFTGELADDGRLQRDSNDTEMNPFCRRAVSQAVRFAQDTHGHSTVITMGPPEAADVAREAIAWGADTGLLVSDPALAGADCLVTAQVLAAAIERQGPADLIVVGRSSVDSDTGVIGPMVAQLLGMPFVGPALFLGPGEFSDSDLDAPRVLRAQLQLDGVVEEVWIDLPAVVSVAERSCRPAKMPQEEWAASGRVRIVTAEHLGQGHQVPHDSPTRVRHVRSVSSARQGRVLHDSSLEKSVSQAVRLLAERGALPHQTADQPESSSVPLTSRDTASRTILVTIGDELGPGSRALLGEAAALAHQVGGKVVALAPSTHPGLLAQWGADELMTANRYSAAPLAEELTRLYSQPPWAVLGPATHWGRELLARLAALWKAGLVSDVIGLTVCMADVNDDPFVPRIVGHKPCGTRNIAEIDSLSATQIVTVRTGCLPLPRPRPPVGALPQQRITVDVESGVRRLSRRKEDDYEALDRAETVIGLGKGVQPHDYNSLTEFQRVLRAEIAATRAVTDASWLPHARQVGVTARGIAPRLYVATGISGSPLHMAGVGRAGSVLAINVDPHAEVFMHSDVGIVGDWRDVVPLLTDEIWRVLNLASGQ